MKPSCRRETARRFTSFMCSNCTGHADEVEYRLIRDLLRNYDYRIRPSLNASEPLNVTFGLALAQIIDVVCVSDQIKIYSAICSRRFRGAWRIDYVR